MISRSNENAGSLKLDIESFVFDEESVDSNIISNGYITPEIYSAIAEPRESFHDYYHTERLLRDHLRKFRSFSPEFIICLDEYSKRYDRRLLSSGYTTACDFIEKTKPSTNFLRDAENNVCDLNRFLDANSPIITSVVMQAILLSGDDESARKNFSHPCFKKFAKSSKFHHYRAIMKGDINSPPGKIFLSLTSSLEDPKEYINTITSLDINATSKEVDILYKKSMSKDCGSAIIYIILGRDNPSKKYSKEAQKHLIERLIKDSVDWYIPYKAITLGDYVIPALLTGKRDPNAEIKELKETFDKFHHVKKNKFLLETIIDAASARLRNSNEMSPL